MRRWIRFDHTPVRDGNSAGLTTTRETTCARLRYVGSEETSLRYRSDEQLDVGLGHLLERGSGADADSDAVEEVLLVVAEEVDGHLTRL